MTTIITRAGAGVPLTNNQVDQNFTNLNTDKLELGGTFSSGTANSVLYLNASKVLTTGSALTFDGTNFATTGSINAGSGQFLAFSASAPSASNFSLFGNSSTTVLNGPSGGVVQFNIANSEQMRLTSTGLGIGESNPGEKLQVVGKILATGDARIGVKKAGSDSVGAGPFFSLQNADASREWFNQLGASNTLDWWYYNGSSYTKYATLDSSGNLGLGVTPSAFSLSGSGYRYLEIGSVAGYGILAGQNEMYLVANGYYNGGFKYANTGAAGWYRQSAGQHQWWTSGPSGGNQNDPLSPTQAMTLDASGNLGIGTTSLTDRLNIVGATATTLLASSTTTNQAYHKVANAGGNMYFGINNSANSFFAAAAYAGIVWHDGAYPIVFGTNNAERARITSGGNLLVGTTVNYSRLTVSNGNSTRSGITISDADTASLMLFAGNSSDAVIAVDTNSLVFKTGATVGQDNGTERARITSGGYLLIGCTDLLAYNPGIRLGPTNYTVTHTSATSTDYLGYFNRESSDGEALRFGRANTGVGTISVTTTATAYNTSSDYRLKDNPQPLTNSGAFIDALKPKTWNWKVNGSRGVGFIAHEVQEVSPSSVTGEKDGEQMQVMEYGSAEFIANIVAELQSLRARVAQLEAKGA